MKVKNAKKSALGKGLGSIFNDLGVQNVDTNQKEVVEEIFLTEIEANPFQPRKTFEKEEISNLANSIQEQGLLQPILVRKHQEKYQIIAGERRFRAFQHLNREKISVFVRQKISDRQMMEISIVENIQRVQLNPIEEARSYLQLVEECGLTHLELSEKVSKSRSHVSNALRLLDLDFFVQDLLARNELSMGVARTLITLSPKEQIRKAKVFLEKGINVRQAEQATSKQTFSKKASQLVKVDPHLKEDLNQLSYFIGSIVDLQGNSQKGVLQIRYSSQEELEQIIHRILFENKEG